MPTTYAIPNGRTVFDATTYSGDSTSPKAQTNTAGFKPDLVWIKDRTNAYSHNIYDSVRGAGSSKDLQSDNTNNESTNATNAAAYGYLSAFNSNGFSTANGTDPTYPSIWVNASSNNYVAWQWQAGKGTTSTNTSGSITSTVSVNATAGFSIVTYTGTLNSTGIATVGHGLGVTPSLIISKSRNNTNGDAGLWDVRHTSLPSWNHILQLQSTAAQADSTGNGAMSAPTSSVFSVNNSSGMGVTGNNYVAYCWAEVAGFSKFGSYVGNGSADGPFVYLGFRPKLVMYKRTDSDAHWVIQDTSRNEFNVANNNLLPSSSMAEVTSSGSNDFLSNGFKVRSVVVNETNVSGATYIYAAFAENPFKYANAR